ncbi:hypothetical protein Golob_010869, partial [Gossypium lobatum]|nr:hypothetical protein [Gossypium lobatum]
MVVSEVLWLLMQANQLERVHCLGTVHLILV